MERDSNNLFSLYEKLSVECKEIRLLIAESDPKTTKFRCFLHTVSLDEAENTFAALSYTWGDLKETVTLIVGDHICQITNNLFSALQNLTQLYPFLVIWIDALCINQNDPIERANQVRIMGEIYEKAEHVLVWLGEADETSHLGMKAMEQIGKASHDSSNKITKAIDSIENLPEEAAFVSIASLLQRPWWSRAWTLQEIALGKGATVVCGTTAILWDWVYYTKEAFLDVDALRKSKLLMAVENHITIFEDKLIEGKMILWSDGRRRRKQPTEKDDLLMKVLICRAFDSTNPLDKIYACVGLAAPLPGLVIDYRITPRQLFTDFAVAHIKHNQSLRILTQAGIGVSEIDPDDPVPSWVPDLRYPRPSSPVPLIKSEAAKPPVSAKFSDGKLTIKGMFADQVVSSTPRQIGRPDIWLKAALEEHPLTYRNSGCPYIQAYFRTCLMEYNYNTGAPLNPKHKSFFAPAVLFSVLAAKFDAEYIPEYIHNYAEKEGRPLHQALLIHMIQQDDPKIAEAYFEFEEDAARETTENEHLEIANFNMRMAILGFDRCFVKTMDGFMGLTPKGTRKGDLIWVIKGCDVPVVLRKVAGTDEFVLLGECFVFGLMPRRIFEDPMLEGRVQEITIV